MLDALPEDKLTAVRILLEVMVEPFYTLENAPYDDNKVTPEESAAVKKAPSPQGRLIARRVSAGIWPLSPARLRIHWSDEAKADGRATDRKTALALLDCVDRFLLTRGGTVEKLGPPLEGLRLRAVATTASC